ncbi:MAG: iron-containing alcohol dehydrogenase [Actinobacteria bacterium]|nr:iron-containing alcohol dehydrogenase [Actinomycetota bacterium]
MNEFPQVLVFESSEKEEDSAVELARQVAVQGIEAPLVLCNIHGKRLASELSGPLGPQTPDGSADQHGAAALGGLARRAGADAIVAVGGGRCIDIAKLAAARAGLTVIAVPTQLSHDGICSPVSVVPDDEGRAQSLGAVAPRLVFISIPTLVDAPHASASAGVGDLLANPLALRDWALAAEHGLEETDQRAWDLSVESFQRIKAHLDVPVQESLRDPEFLRALADALVLSGMAMICSGTSRPASGAEHEISHAIDRHFGGRALHGAQVAFGCVISVALYDEDTSAFRGRIARLGLPEHPSDLGLSKEDTIELLLRAPETRPGRFTVLEDADLDRGKARALVEHIWGDS